MFAGIKDLSNFVLGRPRSTFRKKRGEILGGETFVQ